VRELDGIIDGDRYFLSPRIETLKAILAKIRPEPPKASHPSGEPVCEPLSPPPKRYAPPRATAARRRRGGALKIISWSRLAGMQAGLTHWSSNGGCLVF
jgi:hypothetical protein